MDESEAKKQRNLEAFLAVGPIPALRWYKLRLPCCGKTVIRSLSPILLGPGHRRCRKCDRVVEDGSKEWPELRPSEKFEFVLPFMALCWIGASIVIAGLGLWMLWDEEDAVSTALTGLFAFSFPWYPFLARRWWLVRNSKQRFQSRGNRPIEDSGFL